MAEPIRLATRVAAMVPCSRREAEQYIAGGWVRVDGVVVEEPQFRVANQRVELDPGASLMALLPVTLLLHKPAGATHEDAVRLLLPRRLGCQTVLSSVPLRWILRTRPPRILRTRPLRLLPCVSG